MDNLIDHSEWIHYVETPKIEARVETKPLKLDQLLEQRMQMFLQRRLANIEDKQ